MQNLSTWLGSYYRGIGLDEVCSCEMKIMGIEEKYISPLTIQVSFPNDHSKTKLLDFKHFILAPLTRKNIQNIKIISQ